MSCEEPPAPTIQPVGVPRACAVCGVPAERMCACACARYCSRACQKKDRQRHQTTVCDAALPAATHAGHPAARVVAAIASRAIPLLATPPGAGDLDVCPWVPGFVLDADVQPGTVLGVTFRREVARDVREAGGRPVATPSTVCDIFGTGFSSDARARASASCAGLALPRSAVKSAVRGEFPSALHDIGRAMKRVNCRLSAQVHPPSGSTGAVAFAGEGSDCVVLWSVEGGSERGKQLVGGGCVATVSVTPLRKGDRLLLAAFPRDLLDAVASANTRFLGGRTPLFSAALEAGRMMLGHSRAAVCAAVASGMGTWMDPSSVWHVAQRALVGMSLPTVARDVGISMLPATGASGHPVMCGVPELLEGFEWGPAACCKAIVCVARYLVEVRRRCSAAAVDQTDGAGATSEDMHAARVASNMFIDVVDFYAGPGWDEKCPTALVSAMMLVSAMVTHEGELAGYVLEDVARRVDPRYARLGPPTPAKHRRRDLYNTLTRAVTATLSVVPPGRPAGKVMVSGPSAAPRRE